MQGHIQTSDEQKVRGLLSGNQRSWDENLAVKQYHWTMKTKKALVLNLTVLVLECYIKLAAVFCLITSSEQAVLVLFHVNRL